MIYFFMVMFFLAGYFLGGVSLALYASGKGWSKAETKQEVAALSIEDHVGAAIAEDPKGNFVITDVDEKKKTIFISPDFAVTGKPRAIPWHIRRKELEAAARTKRKKLESFQEYV